MLSLFIVLLSFSKSLATKCLFLKDEPSIVKPTLTDMNPVALKYYPFLISLNKCTARYNVVSPKNMCSKRKERHNVKAFNMITNKNEAKAMAEQV